MAVAVESSKMVMAIDARAAGPGASPSRRCATGRGRAYAAPLAAFAISVAAGIGGVALHFLLGQQVSAREALITLLPSAIVAALLALPLHRLCRALLGPAQRYEPARQVELV